MRRQRLGPAFAIFIATVPVMLPTPTAAAAAQMCQGEEATIVDTKGKVTGTDGDDVIVGGARTIVRAKAGRDTICVRGGRVDGGGDRDKVKVVGSDTADDLAIRNIEDMNIDMGAGADFVHVTWNRFGRGTGSIDVDEDDSDFLTGRGKGTMFVDLPGERLEIDGRRSYAIRGFEDVLVVARVAEVIGNSSNNSLYVESCRLKMSAGPGRDSLYSANIHRKLEPPCRVHSKLMLGQGGNDFLSGGGGSETLIGGAGRDRADGGQGEDRCVAERELSCER